MEYAEFQVFKVAQYLSSPYILHSQALFTAGLRAYFGCFG